MSIDYRKDIAIEITAYQKKLGKKNRRALRTYLKGQHGIDVSESALSKALRGEKGGLSMDTLLEMRNRLRDDCIAMDRKNQMFAKEMGSRPEFADGQKPLREALTVMARKRYSQMPVRVGGIRIVGVITNRSVDQGLSRPGCTDSMPAKDFCTEARYVPWNTTETETIGDVVKHSYVLVDEKGEIVRIVTGDDFPEWAKELRSLRSPIC